MRYVFYLLTLALVFTAGMVVGNLYIPAHTSSTSVAISMPALDISNEALQKTNEANAQEALAALAQGLAACPLVVDQEKDFLFNRISLYLTLQDFLVKKAVYEAEIAKNIEDTPLNSQFSRAAAEYTAAKTRLEQRANELFPPQLTTQPADMPVAITTATVTILPSSPTITD